MKITIKDGRLFEGDKKLFIQTNGDEPFTLFKYFVIANQIANNEAKRYKKLIERGYPLFFEEAIKEAIALGKAGVDFTNEENIKIINTFCAKWRIKFESFETIKRKDIK